MTQARNKRDTSRLQVETLPKLNEERLVGLQVDVDTAQKQHVSAQKELIRQELLRRRGASSESQLSDKQEVVNLRLSTLVNAKQKLAEFRIQSREDIEKARLTYESDEVSLRDAERNLEHTIIRSPRDGLVSLVVAHSGELVEQGACC